MNDYEHAEQVALFDWAKVMEPHLPEIKLLYAIPNGGKRDKRTAGKLKEEGVKAGILDLCLPVPRQGYHGYYIELKVVYPDGTKNDLSEGQAWWLRNLRRQGYKAEVFWGWGLAAASILDYLTEKSYAGGLQEIPY